MGFWSFFTLLCLIGFYVNWYGTTKALRLNANISEEGSKLPSLPSYYGTHSFLWLIIPVITLLIFWFFFKPFIMDLFLSKYVSSKLDSSFTGDPSMLIDTVKATDPEKVFPGTNPLIVESAKYYNQLYLSSDSYVFISILILGLIFSFTSIKRISFSFQARQAVEQSNINLLIICSVIAIITTVGIVFSLIFEAVRFLKKYLFLIFCSVWFGVHKRQFVRIKLLVKVHLELSQSLREHY